VNARFRTRANSLTASTKLIERLFRRLDGAYLDCF
jgi:hypothetical protein